MEGNEKTLFKHGKSSVRELKLSIIVLYDCCVGIRCINESYLLNKLFKMIFLYSVFRLLGMLFHNIVPL